MFLYTSSCIIISIIVAKPKRDHERTNVQVASLRKPGRGHNFLFILNQEFFYSRNQTNDSLLQLPFNDQVL